MIVYAISFVMGALICYGGAELVNESVRSNSRYKIPGAMFGGIILVAGIFWCIVILGYAT